MRVLRAVFAFLAVVSAAFAADLKIKVVDPQSAAVSGAEVSLIPEKSGGSLQVAPTAGDGSVLFAGIADGEYQIQVLAPGFAPQTTRVTTPRT